MNAEAIASEGRLLRNVQARRIKAAAARLAAKIAHEVGDSLPPARVAGSTAGGDPAQLRGLPAIGRGVGGAIAGTRPGAARELEEWSGK